MGKARSLINRMKRRKKSLNENKGYRRQDKINKMDETLNASPAAQKAMRHVARRLDRNFGQQALPEYMEASLEMIRLADLVGVVHVPAVEGVAAFFEGQVAGMTTDVRIEADNEGVAGNAISLSFDGLDDIDTAIADWNLANPSNTASLISGDGSQIPDNLEDIDLAGGVDAEAEVPGSLEATMASGMVRASGLKADDIVEVLSGEMKGQQLKVISVDYGADTIELEPSTLDGSESDIPLKLQLSGVKKSYK